MVAALQVAVAVGEVFFPICRILSQQEPTLFLLELEELAGHGTMPQTLLRLVEVVELRRFRHLLHRVGEAVEDLSIWAHLLNRVIQQREAVAVAVVRGMEAMLQHQLQEPVEPPDKETPVVAQHQLTQVVEVVEQEVSVPQSVVLRVEREVVALHGTMDRLYS